VARAIGEATLRALGPDRVWVDVGRAGECRTGVGVARGGVRQTGHDAGGARRECGVAGRADRGVRQGALGAGRRAGLCARISDYKDAHWSEWGQLGTECGSGGARSSGQASMGAGRGAIR